MIGVRLPFVVQRFGVYFLVLLVLLTHPDDFWHFVGDTFVTRGSPRMFLNFFKL